MTRLSSTITRNHPAAHRDSAPPSWAQIAALGPTRTQTHNGIPVQITQGKSASLITVRLPDANQQDAEKFQRTTQQAYQAIRAALTTSPNPHPVRFWNYLPAIHQPLDASRDRYKVFNAGRFEAFQNWFKTDPPLLPASPGTALSPPKMPAASAVGHACPDLLIHCLSTPYSGLHIENPRQIPAYHYSARFGRLPPAFARATIVPHWPGAPLLIAAGTASIRGEESVCINDLKGQLHETLANLASLITTADGPSANPLSQYEQLRIYYARPDDAADLSQSITEAFGPNLQFELIQADLCRAELLVEIEGIARLTNRNFA